MKRIIKTILCAFMLITLMACGSKPTVIVNFDSDGGSHIDAKVIDANSKVTKPEDPTKDGYRFVEWDLDGHPFSFSSNIEKDITLKAVWQVDENKEETKEETNKEEAPKTIACTGLKTEYNSYWAIEGKQNVLSLEVEISPKDCTEIPKYTSDDETIASVDQKGNITPLKIGKTTIHVTCGEQKLDIKFETRPKKVKVEKLEIADITIKLKETATIKPKFYPENTTQKGLTFESADASKVSVNKDGVITGLIPGPCVIYVKAENDETYKCNVIVEGKRLDIDLPLYSEISYSANNFVNCHAFTHEWKDGQEIMNDVTGSATICSDFAKVKLVGNELYAGEDPGAAQETNVWFTYNDMETIKVTIFVKP